MKIVVYGAGGKLGGALCRAWGERHEVQPVTRAEADLVESGALRRDLEGREFEAVVNCAAVASPDQCHRHPELARAVNARAPRVMAEACGDRGARFLSFSTDYVLDGSGEGLKDEGAATFPNGVYGESKRAGEEAVLEADGRALVCRVSWVFGTDPPGFCDTILRRARRGEPLEAIADKWSMPTFARDIAEWSEHLLAREDLSGIFHLTHTGEPQSWWSYGSKVLEIADDLGLLEKPARIRPTRMAELDIFQAPRPVHTAMRPRRLCEELGLPVRDWSEAVREHLSRQAAGRESH